MLHVSGLVRLRGVAAVHQEGMSGGSFPPPKLLVLSGIPSKPNTPFTPVCLLFQHPPVVWPYPGPSLVLGVSSSLFFLTPPPLPYVRSSSISPS